MATGKYDGATIEVINWDNYNPRTDSAKPTWFRLDNNLATSATFDDLDCEQKWLWIFIMSLVSQKNGEPIIWKTKYCQKLTGIKASKQDETIEIFEKFVRLRVSRNVTLRDSHATDRQTDEQTDRQYRVSDENLERVYGSYPKKIGKQKGISRLKGQIQSDSDLEKLHQALHAFLAYHRRKGTEVKFIPQFDTWTSSWRDWLDPSTGKESAPVSAPTQPVYSAAADRNSEAVPCPEHLRSKIGLLEGMTGGPGSLLKEIPK